MVSMLLDDDFRGLRILAESDGAVAALLLEYERHQVVATCAKDLLEELDAWDGRLYVTADALIDALTAAGHKPGSCR